MAKLVVHTCVSCSESFLEGRVRDAASCRVETTGDATEGSSRGKSAGWKMLLTVSTSPHKAEPRRSEWKLAVNSLTLGARLRTRSNVEVARMDLGTNHAGVRSAVDGRTSRKRRGRRETRRLQFSR
jgi:hypothetical protein